MSLSSPNKLTISAYFGVLVDALLGNGFRVELLSRGKSNPQQTHGISHHSVSRLQPSGASASAPTNLPMIYRVLQPHPYPTFDRQWSLASIFSITI